MLHHLYGTLARARRRYYEQRPHLRRRLHAPVVSIGNLTVGGSSKTPLTAAIARMLVDAGERPAILSRGYRRETPADGVVVVSDGASVRADVAHSGDEPQMLARQVTGSAVLVASSRYLAGAFAETTLGCTVHVLDDGFQHLELMRNIDLLVAPDQAEDLRPLPSGRLREPIDAARSAHALLVEAGRQEHARALGVPTMFEFRRRLGGPAPDGPAFAFAGIARPERFFDDLAEAGWELTGTRAFRDHHPFSPADLDRLSVDAARSGARTLLTTEKDAVRIRAMPAGLPLRVVPLEIALDPAFPSWLVERVRAARAA